MDRIKCRNCGAESYAAGDTGLVCIRCYEQQAERIKELETKLKEYGGQRCTAVCNTCGVAHWCLRAQGHEGEHIHICKMKSQAESIKELEAHLNHIDTCLAIMANTKSEEGIKDLPRLIVNLREYVKQIPKGK